MFSGRVVVGKLGGGFKFKYHWIKWVRDGPSDLNEKPKEEKVLDVFRCWRRTADIALVAHGKDLKYIIATENMKPGDIIRTHCGIPRNPVKSNEGDAFPIGALPQGTLVNCVEKYPGVGGMLIHGAGTHGVILRKDGENRVIVRITGKREVSLLNKCMATVGRVSNILHGSTPIGSVQRNRELGNRPASGLWHRKDGRFGRKIKPPPKLKKINPQIGEPFPPIIRMTMSNYPYAKGEIR